MLDSGICQLCGSTEYVSMQTLDFAETPGKIKVQVDTYLCKSCIKRGSQMSPANLFQLLQERNIKFFNMRESLL